MVKLPVFLIFTGLLAAGCSTKETVYVSDRGYLANVNCWSSKDEDIATFVVLTKIENKFVANAVSANCDIIIDGLNPKTALLLITPSVMLNLGSSQAERDLGYDLMMVKDSITELPVPSNSSKILYIRGSGRLHSKSNTAIISINNVKQVTELRGTTFENLISMDASHRAKFAEVISRGGANNRALDPVR